MITQDYINGYVSALKTIEENLDQRLNHWNDFYRENKDSFSNEQESNVYHSQNELLAVKEHINQLRESYRQLVKGLNESKN